jgi:hypothetical protein
MVQMSLSLTPALDTSSVTRQVTSPASLHVHTPSQADPWHSKHLSVGATPNPAQGTVGDNISNWHVAGQRSTNLSTPAWASRETLPEQDLLLPPHTHHEDE